MTRRIGWACLALVLGLLAGQPWLFPGDPLRTDTTRSFEAPGPEHLLGTDEVGRDVLARLGAGARTSLAVALVAVGLASVLGTALGLAAGAGRAATDRAVSAIVDTLLAFPRFVLLLNVAAIFRFESPALLGVLIGLTSWMRTARLVRTEVLSLRERGFVEAARAAGAGTLAIGARHLAPHVAGLVLETARLRVASVVLTAASLDFLGVGLPLDSPTWGGLIRSGQEHLAGAPWIAGPSIAALCLTSMGLVLSGDKPAPPVRVET